MFDLTTLPHCELQDFLQFHSETLKNASLLFGAKPALKTTLALIDEICNTLALYRRTQQGLERLHELFSPKHVHDPNLSETGDFAEPDLGIPHVENLRFQGQRTNSPKTWFRNYSKTTGHFLPKR